MAIFSSTTRWILGGLCSLVLLLGLMAFNTVTANVADLQSKVPEIAVIRSRQDGQDKKLDKIQQDLDWLVRREYEHADHVTGRFSGPAEPRR